MVRVEQNGSKSDIDVVCAEEKKRTPGQLQMYNLEVLNYSTYVAVCAHRAFHFCAFQILTD